MHSYELSRSEREDGTFEKLAFALKESTKCVEQLELDTLLRLDEIQKTTFIHYLAVRLIPGGVSKAKERQNAKDPLKRFFTAHPRIRRLLSTGITQHDESDEWIRASQLLEEGIEHYIENTIALKILYEPMLKNLTGEEREMRARRYAEKVIKVGLLQECALITAEWYAMYSDDYSPESTNILKSSLWENYAQFHTFDL